MLLLLLLVFSFWDFDLDPMTLIDELDPDILNSEHVLEYQNKFSRAFKSQNMNRTDTHRHRQTRPNALHSRIYW